MKVKKRHFFAKLMVFCMLLQTTLVYGESTLDVNGVPTEVSGNEYVQLNVKQDGEVIQEIQQTLTKGTETGTVVIYVKAYAYKTGDQIKTSTVITYLTEEGKMRTEDFDQIGTLSQSDIGWPTCKDFYIEVDKPLEFDGPNDNQRRVIVSFKTSTGKSFYRHTEENVKFSSAKDKVSLTALNGGVDAIDNFTTYLDPTKLNSNGKTFDTTKYVKKDSTVKVSLDITSSSLSKDPMYQVITSETKPTLPLTSGTWEKMGDLSSVKDGIKKYEDLINTPNLLTVQHYIYTTGYDKAPDDYGSGARDREEVFKYPVNSPVQQSTTLGSNTTYSTQEGTPAFFLKSTISDKTKLTATFVPQVSGNYRFCVYSATGSYGKITINGKDEVFVNNFNQYKSRTPYYHRTSYDSFYLEAGKSYPIYLETQHKSSKDTAPCFMYAIEPAGGWPKINSSGNHSISQNKHTSSCYMAAEEKLWKIVTPDLLKNQNPSNGSNRAAKLWGFIVPKVSGEFNFGLFADDGAYGYLVVDDQKKVFVDSFGLSSAVNQSNGIKISIKENVPYPFYLEWYEGCPTEQALAPRYREPNSDWKDIPSDWFRPSSNLSIGKIPLAMYEGSKVDKEIPLLNTQGKQYVILKVTDKDGNEHQIPYGPFSVAVGKEVVEIAPAGTTDKNYIVPESVSNVNAKVTYGTDCKEVKYTINLDNIAGVKVGGKDTFKLDLSKAVVEITDKTGKQIITDTNTIYEKQIVDNIIIIKVKDNNAITHSGEIHQLNVYFPTSFTNDVIYFKSVTNSNTYMNLIENQSSAPVKVNLTISRKPKTREAVIDTDTGIVILPEEYASTPSEDNVLFEVQLREIPSIH